MNEKYEYVGYAGAALISINLMPQVYHIYNVKKVDSISTMSICLNILSAIVMLIYGIFIDKMPVIISNGMVFLFYIVIGYFKIIYR